MKKFTTILLSFLFISFQSVKAEMGFGLTGALHMFDASGTETTRTSGQKNTGSHSEQVVVPELFVEALTENGGAVGISYIPTRELGSKSRTDSNSEGDSGTYKAQAELDDLIQIYVDFPLNTNIAGYDVYAKVGIQHATIVTLESLNSGSTYPDEDVIGYTFGVGTKGDLDFGNNLYYKAEALYTAFEDYEAGDTANTGNTVSAELEDFALKFSIAYKY